MSVFPTERRIASWAGICPGNNESTGKKSSRTTHGNKITKAASRTKVTYLSIKYQKLAARLGKKRAIIAIGHTILRLVYYILSDRNIRYIEVGSDFADARQKQNAIRRHKKALLDLGVEMLVTLL